MAIPVTYAPILPQDFTLTPMKVSKEFTITNSDTGSGYTFREGLFSGILTPISTSKADNDPKNPDGTFKHLIWDSFNHMYYERPYTPGHSLEHTNRRYHYKHLGLTGSFVTTPYLDRGDRMKPGSIEITNSSLGFTLKDDKNGNLYDESIDSSSFQPRYKTVAHWSFANVFRNFKRGFGTIKTGSFTYNSGHYEVQYPSVLHDIEASTRRLQESPTIKLQSGSYISTPTVRDLQFDDNENFMFSFWIYPEADGNVITKRGVKFIESSGTGSNKTVAKNNPTDRYPYDFSITSGSITVTRSDGVRTSAVSGSISYNEWSLITFFKYDSKIGLRYPSGSTYESMYVDDSTKNPFNAHHLHFGSSDFDAKDGFTGNLAEMRITKDPEFGSIHPESGSLATSSYSLHDYPYNTNIVGNVFYGHGHIGVSSHYNDYNNAFSGSWEMKYKGTHTIYTYETLIRIKKGDFNLSYNPTARKSPKSDELINDFTGSLSPYITTIGLYNDQGDMVAVAKTGQPIKTRDDIDINILARWDI